MGQTWSENYREGRYQQRKSRQKSVLEFAKTKRYEYMVNSGHYRRYAERHEKYLCAVALYRQREERFEGRGEKVYFSRSIVNQKLQHWAVIVNGITYEVEPVPTPKVDSASPPTPNNMKLYTCSVWNHSIEEEMREMKSTEPAEDGFWVALMGWTRLSNEAIKQRSTQLLQFLGGETLPREQAQSYLRELVNEIIVGDHSKAVDYYWFWKNMNPKYQKDRWLPNPPAELILKLTNSLDALVEQEVRSHAYYKAFEESHPDPV